MTDPEKYLSDEAVAEFDRIVGEYERPFIRRKVVRLAAGIAAAAAVATPLLILRPWSPRKERIDPLIMAEGIRNLMELNKDEILFIEAVPKGSFAILTAHMEDGSSRSFIMTADNDGSSIRIASNDK